MSEKQKTKSEQYRRPTREEHAKYLEESERYLTGCLEDAHFVRMTKEVQRLSVNYDDMNKEQRRARLLKINEHLQEILKEKEVPDYDAMSHLAIILRMADLDRQKVKIMNLDPSVYFAPIKTDGEEDGNSSEKSGESCWKRLKSASVGLVKKIAKQGK